MSSFNLCYGDNGLLHICWYWFHIYDSEQYLNLCSRGFSVSVILCWPYLVPILAKLSQILARAIRNIVGTFRTAPLRRAVYSDPRNLASSELRARGRRRFQDPRLNTVDENSIYVGHKPVRKYMLCSRPTLRVTRTCRDPATASSTGLQ